MEYETFKRVLKENKLSLKAFSELAGVKYDTCSKWGKDGRPVSDWVESWLNLYIENKSCKELKTMIKESGLCDETLEQFNG
ncbi:XRE family transcriptional regulator [Sulfurimonas sp. NWX79]|uniref:XRE family transcriptional regulator n=1 Tax=Sulfurimonas sp. NWX79 TaxID=2925412 RepID=UPI003204D755